MRTAAHVCAPPHALQAFQAYIKMILTRKNTITGVVYSEDPTIMSLELANEPHTTCAAQATQNGAHARWMNLRSSLLV